ncbi:MAG: CPBP family intramembrane glutamic endopeptidase [bacterium]
MNRFLPIKLKSALLVLLSAVFIFFSSQIMGAILISVLGRILGYSTDAISNGIESNDLVRFIMILFIETITVWLVFMVLQSQKSNLQSIGLTAKIKFSYLLEAVKGYGIYILIFLAVFVFVSKVGLINTDQAQELGFKNPTGVGLLLAFVSLVILPPIAEEILFRGYLYQRLKLSINSKIAAIITSALFATAHLELGSASTPNWAAALDTFILSFVLIYLANKTKSLYASIFLHAIKNCIAFVTLFVIK